MTTNDDKAKYHIELNRIVTISSINTKSMIHVNLYIPIHMPIRESHVILHKINEDSMILSSSDHSVQKDFQHTWAHPNTQVHDPELIRSLSSITLSSSDHSVHNPELIRSLSP